MVVVFDNEAALAPFLGAFGKPVTLPNGSASTAIVDYVENVDSSAVGRSIRPVSWHFTLLESEAEGIVPDNPLLNRLAYDGRDYQARYLEPDGHGLITLRCALVPE